MTGADFISGEQELDGLGGMDFTTSLGGLFNFRGEGAEFLLLFGKIAQRLEGGVECRDLILGMTGGAELLDEALMRILCGFLKKDGIALFCRNLKMPVVLKFLFSCFKPLLKSCCIKDGWNECCSDLIGCRFTTMIRNDGADEPHRILG